MRNSYREVFERGDITDQIKSKSIIGGLSAFIGESVTFLIRMGILFILARILNPADFGIISMVTALTGFAELFKDMGLSDATIQSQELDQESASKLFWINLLLGLFLTIITLVASPLIGMFYRDTKLVKITVFVSFSFVISGAIVQHQALLNRRMEFTKIAIIKISAYILSSALAIILALAGFGYWTLVWKDLSLVIFFALGIWISYPWIPNIPKRAVKVGSFLRFGWDVTRYNIVNYFSRSLDRVLIGRCIGPSELGIYDRALNLMTLPASQIRFPLTRVALAGLSSLQKDEVKYRNYFLKMLSVLSFLYMPLVVFLAINARPFIIIALGDKWLPAVNIFRILALVSFIGPALGTTDVILISLGRTKKYLKWGIIYSVSFIISYFIGINWGAIGVAGAFTIANIILVIPTLLDKLNGTPVTPNNFLRSIAPALLSSLFMGIVLFIFDRLTDINSPFIFLSTSFIVGIITYFLIWIIIPGGGFKLREYISYIQAIFNK